ncbi:hypothetical protein S7S_02075 [Isoalcanivorax pacificus W11-5]|uniref:TIGR02444 family protein n=1 Tax=Isoalcanivorax pacificus W11-5 TaxID=391936 RepID=A0A0B4XK98_9GAMM|nr:TIGR02444 family protein [Isoalcanivorax pacificus]AJD46837.1 hypothetical protein S7S_02075 [Isoalcanivorax pacificus W11-5]
MTEPSLWQYALTLWKRPGVEHAALLLQDQHSLPVCLLLAALWLAGRGVTPDAALAAALRDIAEEWERERIAPLRRLRRQAGTRADWADWKRALQDAELEAERLLVSALETRVAARPLPRAAQPLPAHGWLLLVIPEMAGCENLTRAVDALLGAAQP